MDYTIPTAVKVPMFEIEHPETRSPFTPLEMNRIGESCMCAALDALSVDALCGAIENAFASLEVRTDELPLTRDRVWCGIRDAKSRKEPV